MFQKAENGTSISRDEYQQRVPELRRELIDAQFALQEAGIPVIIIMAGVEAAGKGEVVNRIHAWMDTRGIETRVFRKETEEMRKRPFYWRFWNVMPSKGDAAVFFGSWYTRPIGQKTFSGLSDTGFQKELEQIRFHEQMLAADGHLIIKLWLHISEEEQEKRLRELEENPKTSWRVDKSDWKHHKKYRQFTDAASEAIRLTDKPYSRWHIIDAAQRRNRDLSCMETILDEMKSALESKKAKASPGIASGRQKDGRQSSGRSILDQADLTKKLSEKEYDEKFEKLSLEIEYLAWQCYQKEISSVFVFEGWDAAGKGGAIRRLTASLDAKLFRVIQIAAPTDEEKAHHYLWRFWRHIPADGNITIYDRSWYGRVLVERVEGFAAEHEWERAYDEIRNFEEQLTGHGTIVQKYWLQISSEEQKARFRDRDEVDFKRYKLTDEDWRNREKRDRYEDAVEEMLRRTGTKEAPWIVVSAEDKLNARIGVLESIRDGMKKALSRK
jgi:AMP-polyphosphate phosphotransferase